MEMDMLGERLLGLVYKQAAFYFFPQLFSETTQKAS